MPEFTSTLPPSRRQFPHSRVRGSSSSREMAHHTGSAQGKGLEGCQTRDIDHQSKTRCLVDLPLRSPRVMPFALFAFACFIFGICGYLIFHIMILFRYPFWVLLFLGPVVQAHEPDVVDLTSLSWTLSNPDGSVSVPATFPSQVRRAVE